MEPLVGLGVFHHGRPHLPPLCIQQGQEGTTLSRKQMGPGARTLGPQPCQPGEQSATYLFFLLVEVVNDDTDEKVQGEERPEDDEHDKVDVHVEVVFPLGLLFILEGRSQTGSSDRQAVGCLGVSTLWERGGVQRKVTGTGVIPSRARAGWVGSGVEKWMVAGEDSRHAGLRPGTGSLHGFAPGPSGV